MSNPSLSVPPLIPGDVVVSYGTVTESMKIFGSLDLVGNFTSLTNGSMTVTGPATFGTVTTGGLNVTGATVLGVATIGTLVTSGLSFTGITCANLYATSSITGASLLVTGPSVFASITGASLDVIGPSVFASITGASLDVSGSSVFAAMTGASLNVTGSSVFASVTSTSLDVTGSSVFAAVTSTGLNVTGASVLTGTTVSTLFSTNNVSAGSVTMNGKVSATQLTDILTTVTANGPAGTITTFAATTGSLSTATFTVNNSFVSATSIVMLQMSVYNGTLTGIPVLYVSNITNGSFDVTVCNYGTTDLDSDLVFSFMVV